MSNELRYSELKYNGQIYTEQWKIDEILIQNKFNWMVNAEIKNARLEIFQDTLVFNAGIWYNGDWYFGVWRDGEWRYGNWQNGVWYNGVWRDGTFKSGIIYNGKFFKGKIVTGEIRGGQFIDIEIAPEVTEFTGDEYQVRQGEVQKSQTATANTTVQPQTDQVRVHSTQPANLQPVAQPSIQQEKKEYKNMKKIKSFEKFVNEELEVSKGEGRYKFLLNHLSQLKKNWQNAKNEESKSAYMNDIRSTEAEIKSIEQQGNVNFKKTESVGDLEDSFVDVNIDETDLEGSELGKLTQKDGKIIIETPSKTDAYNAKMRLGGNTIQDKGFADKQILTIKNTK